MIIFRAIVLNNESMVEFNVHWQWLIDTQTVTTQI